MRARAFASFAAVSTVAVVAFAARDAASDPVAKKTLDAPNGVRLLRAMGPHAESALAPATGRIGALVALPNGVPAASLGLDDIAPGIGRMRGTAAQIDAFATAHPGLRVEVAPPLHMLLKQVGVWTQSAVAIHAGMDGRGALVGVADTGVDVTHPDMKDASGHTRVQWLLDLSLRPYGKYPDLEKAYGVKDDAGNVVAGAVLDAEEIDKFLSKAGVVPSDEVGHGTHVTSIAASSGLAKGAYPGVAPGAGILFVRVTHAGSEAIENDDLVNAVKFMFDRADFMKKPVAVNLSLGSDFGSHDGHMLWEQTIASYVGADKPGHVLVAAAGNSGSVADLPIHQVVHVAPGATTLVPVITKGATSGTVQVWVSLRKNASIKVGLDGPDGEWISPVGDGEEAGKNTSDYNAGVIFGQSDPQTPIPVGSRGAVVVWTGQWPSGTYNVKLDGDGTVDLYLQGIGDASSFSQTPAHFADGVREGTINLPATNENIIGVGCTVNHVRWTSIAGADVGISVPVLDPSGGLPDPQGRSRDLQLGEICWFSSAGPNALGVAKPEIAAPGGVVIAGMSSEAPPSSPNSIFNSAGDCPKLKNGASDDRCLQVDSLHAVSVGTSMSSPIVAGAAAILLQRDPTLTQPQVTAALQAGAHRFRGLAQFDDQSGPGEVDVVGALNALDHMKSPVGSLPAPGAGWITLSESFVPADGSTEMTVICELRTPSGDQADFIDPTRLNPVVLLDGQPQSAPVVGQITRRGPGVWVYTVDPPPGFGGSYATFGLEMDGQPIVQPKSVPVATDPWNASYPSHAVGACNVHSIGARASGAGGAFAAAAFLVVTIVRKKRRAAASRDRR
jgi:subtilisin family serine protease